jgi:hypothetical protein
VHAHRAQQRADVVPRRLVGDAEATRDLGSVEPLGEQAEHLELARRQRRGGRVGGRLREWHRDAEDPDDRLPAPDRCRRDAQREAVALSIEHRHVEDLLLLAAHGTQERRAGTLTVLGHDAVDEDLPAPVAEELQVAAVDPREAAVAVD